MAVKWRQLLQGATGIAVTTVVLLVCIAYFAVGVATRSHPTAYDETLAEVSDSVRIFRNSFGIPHIVGASDPDLVYAQGYAHAQDRLWQMDVWRRTAQGRLAEIFGESYASTDAFMRSMDLRRIVHQQYSSLSPDSKKLLKAYANGVSRCIANNKNKMPFEIDALGYSPEPWTAEDCLLVARLLALQQSPSVWNDVVYAQIAQQRGLDAMLLYVPRSTSGPYSLDTSTRAGSSFVPSNQFDSTTIGGQALGSMLETLKEVHQRIGFPTTTHASNCWAVGRGSDGAILANDPHHAVGLPSRWYQVHLTSPSMNVVGLSIPGLPFVLSGRNDSLSWGLTSAMVDDVDYAVERVDPSNQNYYFEADGSRKKFRYRRDTIKIRSGSDSLIDLRFTSRGCIVSDAHPLRTQTTLLPVHGQPASKLLRSTSLIIRWIGQYNSDEVAALYRINRAHRVEDVHHAASLWGSPALVVNVATKSGVVSTVGMGYAPNRSGIDPLLPHSASKPMQGWNGVVKLSDIPAIVKRSPGSVASANNRIAATGIAAQSFLWEPNSRIVRIQDQLDVYRNMSARDAQVLQQDVTSPYALEFTKTIVPIIKRARKRFGPTELAALSLLEKWDGSMTEVSPAASIHATLLQHMVTNTYQDELGMPLFNLWSYLHSIPTRRILEMLSEPMNPLFDDLRTKDKENLAWIAVRSFQEAVRDLQQTFNNTDARSWKWGSLHQVTFEHPMGSHQLLKPVVNSGPYEVGGSSTTVFNTEWNYAKPFAVRSTVSARVISDMSDSVQYCVLPGGISGQALEGHYADQIQLWAKGGYVRIPVSATPDVTFRMYLLLVPTSVPL
ncbi:MAG: penicillin acylase family protein [Bradyrhizobiaceae bacterium]|nr:penicillin acylase family protein [Bradyrhizobiaceae bacterium]